MRAYGFKFILLSGCMSVIFCGTVFTDVSAASRQQKDPSSAESADRLKKTLPNPSVKKPIKQKMEQTSPSIKAQENQAGALQPPTKDGAAAVQKKVRQVPRQGPGSKKKTKAHAVLKPHANLMYHGILEGPSRYDPRPNGQTAGGPTPQASDMAHDHFQELDRNRDGKIDPVEKAFGRLDMDRDLSIRHWQ